MGTIIVNGDFISRNDANIDIEDRGYQFGDGVYEVIRVYNGEMFASKEHLYRLYESAEKIGLHIRYELEELHQLLYSLIEKNNLKIGTIYMQFTRGVSARSHVFPNDNVVPTFVAYTKEVTRPVDSLKQGVKTILVEDIRWLRCDIKSLNLLGNLLAKQRADESGCFEAIQHRGQTVTEGSLSNVSIVKNGVIITHPATNLILNGITRQKVLELCRINHLSYEEREFTLDELRQADEVFLTGTTVEVMPIIEVDGEPVQTGLPGELTQQLQRYMEEEIIKQCGAL